MCVHHLTFFSSLGILTESLGRNLEEEDDEEEDLEIKIHGGIQERVRELKMDGHRAGTWDLTAVKR